VTNEIGGEFWQEEVGCEPNNYFTRFDGDFRFTISGRIAIYVVLNEVKINNNVEVKTKAKVAYLPVYCCESMIKPFLDFGYEVAFYDVTIDFNPVLDMSKLEQSGVLVICDYFGFPCAKLNDKTRDVCLEHGVIIIHDITMSLFTTQAFCGCDYLIGSHRKWMGVPSGGFAVSMRGIFKGELGECDMQYVNIRRKALALKAKYASNPTSEVKEDFLHAFAEAEDMLEAVHQNIQDNKDNKDNRYSASDPESIKYVKHYNYKDLITQRRSNYFALAKGFSRFNKVRTVFTSPEESVCPMFFVIYTDDRDKYRQHLISNGIYPPVHWPHTGSHEYTPAACEINKTILSIPCDQRYSTSDMERIISVSESYFDEMTG